MPWLHTNLRGCPTLSADEATEETLAAALKPAQPKQGNRLPRGWYAQLTRIAIVLASQVRHKPVKQGGMLCPSSWSSKFPV